MNDKRSPPEWEERFSRSLRVIALWGAFAAGTILAILELGFFYHSGLDPWVEVAKQHFLATIGLTGFALVSFSVVIFLRHADGPIEFEIWGLKFRGAAGQVVIWVFCVIALSVCAKLLW
jgi:hypothetical protein